MFEHPPRHIGPYRITGVLGEGGMGTVYGAWDDRLRRPVAIKLIRSSRTGDRRARRRFRREARALAGLSHPSIVQIFDVLETDRGDAIVLERVSGETLRERMQRHPPTALEAVAVGRRIAAGLAAAHRRGLAHRDLKADNVMIAEAGQDLQVKILDFGLAKPLTTEHEHLSEEGAVIGSYLAMSPEQAQGLDVDHRSDLFSLGALLYQMITGRPPFAGKNVPETLINICTLYQDPVGELAPGTDAGLSELIDRLLAKDPARRPQSADEVVAVLARLLDQMPATPSADVSPPPETAGDSAAIRPDSWLYQQTIFGDSPSSGLWQRAREALLDRVEHLWIEGVLETAVPAGGRLRLRQRLAPSRVAPRWRGVATDTGGEPAVQSSAREWFGDLGRAVLILGEPGSGKTFRLLELAQEVLILARDDLSAPLPVVLPLASWTADRGSLSHWVADELNLRYFIPRPLADGWMRRGELLLLLDGLDEVAADQRRDCAEAVNRLRRQAGLLEIAVTCRNLAYRELEDAGCRLTLDAAVELQPLSVDEIDEHLRAPSSQLGPSRGSLEADPALKELLSNPLMLSAYLDSAWETPAPHQSPEVLRRQVLAGYVRRLLQRPAAPESPFSNQRIAGWLSSLAKGLLDSRQAMFQVERLQPSWLPAAASRRSYLILSRLLLVAAVGSIVAVMGAVAPIDQPVLEMPVVAMATGVAVAGLDAKRFRKSPRQPGTEAARGKARRRRFLAVAATAAAIHLAIMLLFFGIQPGFLIFGALLGWQLGWKATARGFEDDIRPMAALAWSWRKARKGLAVGAALGVLMGVGMAIATTVPTSSLTPSALLMHLLGPLAFSSALGTVAGGLRETVPTGPVHSNFGTWISLRSALVGGGSLAAAAALVGLAFGLFEPWLIDAEVRTNFLGRPLDFEQGWTRVLPLTFFAASFGALAYGIQEVIKHAALRWVLWRSGRLPMRFAPFLAAAGHLGLLRLGAGGAVFRHRLLLEYFAGEANLSEEIATAPESTRRRGPQIQSRR